MLVLSAVPCCSEEKCNDEIKTEQSANHSQENKDSDCNTCSPFFSCGTCWNFVFTSSGFDFAKVFFNKDKIVSIHKSQFVGDFVANIWQPPKIV